MGDGPCYMSPVRFHCVLSLKDWELLALNTTYFTNGSAHKSLMNTLHPSYLGNMFWGDTASRQWAPRSARVPLPGTPMISIISLGWSVNITYGLGCGIQEQWFFNLFFYLAFRWVIFFLQLEESISMLNTPKPKTSQPINCPIAQSISQPNN